ncbi:MAG: hypothetical protein K2L13_00915 [Opitutales bacterium]|nr:hypothetical protein [Opitutales bacterium]
MELQLSYYKRFAKDDLYRAVDEICAVLIANGARPYFVGGCVRDALLGQPISDFDIEVFGISPEKIVQVLAYKFDLILQKRLIYGCESFGVFKIKGYNIDLSVPRAETKIGDKHSSFSVDLLPNSTVQEAASRRDFTINAIYFDTQHNILCDPYGGVGDLHNKILKNVGERFVEDPLRVLRGMQFISRFELMPADSLIELAKTLTPDELSAERIFLEWKKLILLGVKPSLGLRFLEKCGWLKFFPEIQALISCDQDPYRHPEGNVLSHTCLVLDLFANDRSGDDTEDLIVGFAALCHDFGKPITTIKDDSGVHHRGHDVAGLPLVEAFLRRMRAPNWLIDGVKPLVECHMLLRGENFQSADEEQRESKLLKLANKVGRIDRLLRICTYDSHGRGGIWGDPRSSEYELPLIEWAKEVSIKFDVFCHPPVPIIQGRDLLKLGLPQSPDFKSLLEQIFEAQLDLVFTDYEGGMKYARSLLQGDKSKF